MQLLNTFSTNLVRVHHTPSPTCVHCQGTTYICMYVSSDVVVGVLVCMNVRTYCTVCVCVCVCVCVGCRSLLATHFHTLAEFANKFDNVGAYKLVARRSSSGLVFTYQIQVR